VKQIHVQAITRKLPFLVYMATQTSDLLPLVCSVILEDRSVFELNNYEIANVFLASKL